MPSSQKASAQLMIAMQTTHKLSLRPESETKLLNTISNMQQIDTTIVGRKDTIPQFSCLFPLHHSMNHPRHMQKGPQWVSSFYIRSYAQPHSVQSYWTRDGNLCTKNNGHQTLAYLLHIMTVSWKQCFNSWWNYNRT